MEKNIEAFLITESIIGVLIFPLSHITHVSEPVLKDSKF